MTKNPFDDQTFVEKWRKDILARLSLLESKARRGQRQLVRTGEESLDDNSDLRATWEAIDSLFPDGFKPNRWNDLRRHIGFAQGGDFEDILEWDLPSIRRSIELFKVDKSTHVTSAVGTLELGVEAFELISPVLRDEALQHFHNHEYALMARTCVESVMRELRRLSGLSLDGTKLINTAIGVRSGKIGFSPCQSDNERSITNGLKNVLTGLYTGVRNPSAHGWDEMSRIQALQIAITCSYLLDEMVPVEAGA